MKTTKPDPEIKARAVAARHALREALAAAGEQSGRAIGSWNVDALITIGERIRIAAFMFEAAEAALKEAQS